MRFLGFNLSFNRNSKIKNQKSADETPVPQLTPDQLAWLRGNDTGGSGPVLSNAYQQVVWVYRAINIIAEQIANIPFLISHGERGRENLITSGPLLDFYNRPHPNINRFQYWELRIMWLMLRGECIRIPIYSDTPNPNLNPPSSSSFSFPSSKHSSQHSNTPVADRKVLRSRRLSSVLILDPARFQHIIDDTRLIGWRYTGLGPDSPLESQVFLPEEVWFEKFPNPFDFWRGMSPLSVAATAAQTDFAAGSFMKGLIENNADLGLIVRTDQPLDDAQQEQVLAELRNRKRRAGTADKPLLLWSGVDVVKPELSCSDLQFLENRKFCRSEICAAFGVPEELVSTTANSQYDVMAGARQNFIENRIAPLCARLEAEENTTTIPAILGSSLSRSHALTLSQPVPPGSAGILPASPSPSISHQLSTINSSHITGWFDLDSLPIMQQARRNRLATAKTGFDMGVPFNELNRVFDLGFKPLPWGDTGFLPSKYQPLLAPPERSVGRSQSQS
jgi:HK97 family phage portal protein